MDGTTVPWGALGLGGLAGYAAGYALKQVGRIVALLVGLFFIGVQVLAYQGYLQVDWVGIQRDLAPALEPTAVQGAWERLLGVLTYNLPFAAGFVPGFWIGLRGR